MIKGCRSFAGMVNFVSLFCPELQNLLEKGDSFFGVKNNDKPLIKSNIDFKDPQSYIYPTDMDVFNCILIEANLPLVVHCIKSRMDNQDL